MRKSNSKGRSKYDHHVRIYDWLQDTEAWTHSSGNEIKALLYIARFEFGDNNGQIHMSERRLANGVGIDRKTASKCLLGLQDKGFIACTVKGSFRAKASPASLWRLTWRPWPERSQGPTHEYREWRPKEKTRGEKFPGLEGEIPNGAVEQTTVAGKNHPLRALRRPETANAHLGKAGPLILAIGENLTHGWWTADALLMAWAKLSIASASHGAFVSTATGGRS